MKLRRLQIDRLPGIQPGFSINQFGPGINVVTGPNASGKSSLMRALRACLYTQEANDSWVSVEAEFDTQVGDRLQAIRMGRELHWQREGSSMEAPPLPDFHLLSCYTLQVEDLLAGDHATDEHIAEQLRRELAGGYDIAAIAAAPPFRITPTRARIASERLAAAEKHLRECQGEQESLQRDEQGLAALLQQGEAARAAQQLLEACRQASALLATQRERQRLEARLQEFPPQMERLRGDEQQQLLKLREQLQTQKKAQLTLEQKAAEARARLTRSGLENSTLQLTQVAEQQPALRQLAELERQLRQVQEAQLQAKAELEHAVQRLGGQPPQLPKIDPQSLQKVESELDGKRRLDAELRELQAAIERLTASDQDPQALDLLRQARQELLHWLSAPTGASGSRQQRLALLLLGLTAVIGAGAAWWLHPLLTPALLLPTAIVGYLAWRQTPVADNKRDLAQQRYPAASVSAPASWEPNAVNRRMRELDQEVAAAETGMQAQQQRAALAQQLKSRRQDLERLEADLGELAHGVGFDPRHLDASFERWLRLVSELDRASEQQQVLAAKATRTQEQAEALRTGLLAFVAEHGESAEPAAAEVLEQRLTQLQDRLREREHATEALRDIEKQRLQLTQEMTRSEQEVTALFERAGIADQNETLLQQRLDALASWQQLRRELDEQRSVERDRRARLEGEADLLALVEAGDEAGLLRRQEDYHTQAERWQPLIEEVARIRDAIQRAGRERRLEAARAQVQQARDELEDALEETLVAEAGSFLLAQVNQEHVRSSQPAALRQAAEWFARFTRHQFSLEFPDEAAVGFTALDNSSGEQRHLSQLSSGTRMQLLLAVRLAFALQAERGREPLPLILDETLTTSDPQRFAAVAQSLHTLVRDDGRQIFYLSSQPGDIAYWRDVDPDAHIIDLPAIRQLAGALDDPTRFVVPAPAQVPAPGSDTPEQYAVRIGVPGITLWDAPDQIHLFYLLRDQLPLLQHLLQAGIERLGQLQSLLDGEQATLLLDASQCVLLQRRSDAARRWQRARRQGQGRPIDRSVLEAAEAVSDVQLERVEEQRQAVNGDAAALIQSLRDGKVARFRSNKIDELQDWFVEQGYIDSASVLGAEEVLQRVLGALVTPETDSVAALAEAQALVASLENGVV